MEQGDPGEPTEEGDPASAPQSAVCSHLPPLAHLWVQARECIMLLKRHFLSEQHPHLLWEEKDDRLDRYALQAGFYLETTW